MDQQHLCLVETLNELHDAMIKGDTRNLTGPLLESWKAYSRDHFAAEESLLSRTGYPGLAEHRSKHKDLTEEVQEYASRLQRGEVALSWKMMGFLKAWLTAHIQQEDRAYGPWLNEHGFR